MHACCGLALRVAKSLCHVVCVCGVGGGGEGDRPSVVDERRGGLWVACPIHAVAPHDHGLVWWAGWLSTLDQLYDSLFREVITNVTAGLAAGPNRTFAAEVCRPLPPIPQPPLTITQTFCVCDGSRLPSFGRCGGVRPATQTGH
jgi:hypothetical protein